MTCRLTKNIKHSCEYSPGGIKEILLLDIRDFGGYRFKDDNLYNECYVESIGMRSEEYIHLDVVNESNFTETKANNSYKQELTTFVRNLEGQKTADLLLANSNKYLVLFKTYNNRVFAFGSDGGAALNFTQVTGQLGESSGYNITLQKESVYPLFEVAVNNDTAANNRIFDITFDFTFD